MNTHAPIKNKRGKTGQYFTSETEEWINRYVAETDNIKRDIIIRNYLYKPLKKLCEIFYNKLSLPYLDRDNTQKDLQNDCFTHLITNSVYKFKGGKGKAFSYLSIAARNHYIQANRKAQVRYNAKQHNLVGHDEEYADTEGDRLQYNEEFKEKYYGFILWVKEHLHALPFNKSIKDTILHLLVFMDNFDEIQNYFKLEVNTALRKRHNLSETHLKNAKDKLHSLWLQYKRNWENEELDTPPHFASYSKVVTLTEEQIQYIIKTYKPISHRYSATAIAVNLSVPRHLVWEVLKMYNLRSCD